MEELLAAERVDGIAVSSTVGYSDELKALLASELVHCKGVGTGIGKEGEPMGKEYGNAVIYLNHETPIPIENLYSTPETLGPDRLAAVIGAKSLMPNSNVLVIDMGTAITYDFASAEGQYLGGNISPGIEMRLRALHEFTAKLPLVSQTGELPLIGNCTETAIRVGVMMGVKSEIEGYIRTHLQKKTNVSVFLTGGDTINFEDSVKSRIFAQKFLVHVGLESVFEFNNRSPLSTKGNF